MKPAALMRFKFSKKPFFSISPSRFLLESSLSKSLSHFVGETLFPFQLESKNNTQKIILLKYH